MWRKIFKGRDAVQAKEEAERREKEITPTLNELRKVRRENHVYQTIYSTLRGHS